MAPLRRVALALLIVAPAVAYAAAGIASFTGASTLAVRGCGKDRGAFSGSLAVAGDGTWSAQVTEAGRFAGTYTVKGRSGRKLVLTLDAASIAAVVASIEADVGILCETPPATATSYVVKVLTLKLNRKLTKAALVVKAKFVGSAGDRPGSATYKVVGRGPWTPA